MMNINQLTEQLRMLPDQALQRVAMMYKQDPYIFPMVISESMARKKLRMAAQAQGGPQGPQPKVADQALMSMAEPPPNAGLPGLPAPNMQNMADGGIAGYADEADMDFAQRSEPVVKMADGGVARYRTGGSTVRDFEALIRNEAERQGVDPDIALRMFMAETGGEADATTAVSPKGATGLGQLMVSAAKDMGLSPEDRKDPVKNVQASVGYLKRQLDKYGTYDKALAAYNFGPGNLDKHLEKNKGTLNPLGLPKETADYLTKILPMGSAQAAPKTALTAAGEIPGQAVQAPPAVPEGFFSRLGSNLGMSEETKRNVGNILMAPTPMGAVTAPGKAAGEASGIQRLYDATSRFFGSPSAARKLTPEEIQAMQTATAASRNTKAAEDAAEAARMSGAMSGEAKMVSQGVTAERLAEQAAKTPSAAERIQLLQQAERAREAARASNVVSPAVRRGQEAKQLTALGVVTGNEEARTALPTLLEQASYSNEGRNYPAPIKREDLPKDIKKEALATAKEEIPKKERKGFTNDDLIEIGLRMMMEPGTQGEGFAGLMKSAGRAGLGALAARKEREKVEREEAKALSEEKYRAALTREAEGKASMYEEGTRGKTAALQQANVAFANWEKGLSALQKLEMTEEQRKAKYDEILRQTFAALGLEAPAGVSSRSPGASVDTTGFRVLGVRNP